MQTVDYTKFATELAAIATLWKAVYSTIVTTNYSAKYAAIIPTLSCAECSAIIASNNGTQLTTESAAIFKTVFAAVG